MKSSYFNLQVCTFKLVLKNAASLLEDTDPTKVEAEAKLTDLERYFRMIISFLPRKKKVFTFSYFLNFKYNKKILVLSFFN